MSSNNITLEGRQAPAVGQNETAMVGADEATAVVLVEGDGIAGVSGQNDVVKGVGDLRAMGRD